MVHQAAVPDHVEERVDVGGEVDVQQQVVPHLVEQLQALSVPGHRSRVTGPSGVETDEDQLVAPTCCHRSTGAPPSAGAPAQGTA